MNIIFTFDEIAFYWAKDNLYPNPHRINIDEIISEERDTLLWAAQQDDPSFGCDDETMVLLHPDFGYRESYIPKKVAEFAASYRGGRCSCARVDILE